ncbi:MAG: hypothetical protein ACSHX9_00095 [Luteolibacter sp.]
MTSAPSSGDIVRLRTRHYVVEGANQSPNGTVVDVTYLDDDSQARPLSAIWEPELDGEIITNKEGNPGQLELFKLDELRQVEDDIRYWRKWLAEVDNDLLTEPTRIEPVGIVYLWPEK